MRTFHQIIQFKTNEELDFIDFTDKIAEIINEGQIKDGLVNVQTFHTTTGLILNENEPLLIKDLKENLKKLAPGDIDYNHDNFNIRTVNMCVGECANGRSHCKAIYLLKPAISYKLAYASFSYRRSRIHRKQFYTLLA